MFLGAQDAPRRTQGFRPEDAAWHGHAWPEFPSGAEPRALSTSSVGLLPPALHTTPHPFTGGSTGQTVRGRNPRPRADPRGLGQDVRNPHCPG